jgi:hypothetical protein
MVIARLASTGQLAVLGGDMWLQRAALAVVGVIGVGIILIGTRFLLDPAASAAGFGVPVPPGGRSVPGREGGA